MGHCCTGRLVDAIYLSAKNGDSDPPFPAAWSDHKVSSKCHYALMHMLFLGHVKSSIDMVSLGIFQMPLCTDAHVVPWPWKKQH